MCFVVFSSISFIQLVFLSFFKFDSISSTSRHNAWVWLTVIMNARLAMDCGAIEISDTERDGGEGEGGGFSHRFSIPQFIRSLFDFPFFEGKILSSITKFSCAEEAFKCTRRADGHVYGDGKMSTFKELNGVEEIDYPVYLFDNFIIMCVLFSYFSTRR